MYENKWLNEFEKNSNKKVLLMLSGGKDSSASLHILSKAGVDVTAIHFKHKWGYNLSTEEARRLCKKLNISLIEIDFSENFYNAIRDYKGGRPCLLCKPKMYEIVIEKLKKGDYGWVCIGDNANDRTTIVRLMDYIKDKDNENKYCSTYFGSERGIVLPDRIKVIRPLLDLEAQQVEEYLENNEISIKKNHSTGDKYFEYAREGCPVQFHDPGYKITEENMDDLQKYNLLITKIAKEYNIRASIHLPSTFIVTIPKGYERKVGEYLESKGAKINWNINSNFKINKHRVLLMIKNLNEAVFNENIQEVLFERMFERLELKIRDKKFYKYNSELNYIYELELANVSCRYIKDINLLSIDFISDIRLNEEKLENLILEIFRTRNFQILKSDLI